MFPSGPRAGPFARTLELELYIRANTFAGDSSVKTTPAMITSAGQYPKDLLTAKSIKNLCQIKYSSGNYDEAYPVDLVGCTLYYLWSFDFFEMIFFLRYFRRGV